MSHLSRFEIQTGPSIIFLKIILLFHALPLILALVFPLSFLEKSVIFLGLLASALHSWQWARASAGTHLIFNEAQGWNIILHHRRNVVSELKCAFDCSLFLVLVLKIKRRTIVIPIFSDSVSNDMYHKLRVFCKI